MKKLAIVGSGPETREKAPFDDLSFDIWVLNEAPLDSWCKRWDASLQMHIPELYSSPHNTKHPEYWEWLREKHNKPVYMQKVDPQVPDSVEYPLDEVIKMGGCKFLGQSATMMLPLALILGYEHIEIWGVEMSYTEYQYGAGSWRYWVGFARGRLGADHVVLHSGQKLFESLIYGYEGAQSFGHEFFEKRAKELDDAWKKQKMEFSRVHRRMKLDLSNNKYKEFADNITKLEELAQDTGRCAGALHEAQKYAGFGNRHSDRGEFERAAAVAAHDGEEHRVLMYHKGGMVEYVWEVWNASHNEKAARQLWQLLERLGNEAYEVGIQHGIYTENLDYINKYDGMSSAMGKQIDSPEFPYPEVVKA